MKTLEQFYNELNDSEELREGLLQALKEKQTETFCKAHGCSSSEEEITEFLRKKTQELSDEDLSDVVGGKLRPVCSMKSSKGYTIGDWLRIIWMLL